jgi:hypothetical protein
MHVIVKPIPGKAEIDQIADWAESTPDGGLLDLDIFDHDSTFVLSALSQENGRMSYLPVQQPLMLENLIFRPGLSDRERALAITRMTEHAISEAYRRDVGELYFLCRHPETCAFAERHKFVDIGAKFGLKTYRLNLRETFGD